MNEKKEHEIHAFAWSSFLNDLGGYMVFSLWPVFLTSVLGANMAIVGFIDGLGDALVSISQAASGYFSDRLHKRKVFIWMGYMFGALARSGYAISTAWPQVIPFRILDRAGKMREAPRDAIVADDSFHKNRGKNFGYIKQMDQLGAVVGVLAAIVLVLYLDYKTIFALAAIPSLISVLLIVFFIKEKKDGTIRLHKGIKLTDLSKNYRRFLIAGAILSIASFSYSFLIIFAKLAGWPIVFLPVLYFLFILFAAVFSLPFGRLADKIGRRKVIFISIIFWILTCVIFVFIQNPIILIFAFVLYGLHKAALEPAEKTFVSELAPKEFRASALGGYQMVMGLCALPASTLAGLLWDNFGTTVPFALSLVLTIIAAAILLMVKEKK